MDKTNEFSFKLKPSKKGGVGVFAMHDIKNGTDLRLMGNDEYTITTIRKQKDVPKEFLSLCLFQDDGTAICPKDFGNLELVWFLNHSKKNLNAEEKEFIVNGVKKYKPVAIRDIKAGEEILVDYNIFEEPEEFKDDYYKI